jgi:type II secretory pathway component PulF
LFLVIDPSFGILVESADKAGCAAHSKSGLNKKLIAAIAVPVAVFVVVLVIALVVIIPRLHLKSQIFSAKRRTKTDGGVEL